MISEERLQGIEAYLKRPAKERQCIGSISDSLAKELLKEIRELRVAGVESRRAANAIGRKCGEYQTALQEIDRLDKQFPLASDCANEALAIARRALAGEKAEAM